MAALITGVNT